MQNSKQFPQENILLRVLYKLHVTLNCHLSFHRSKSMSKTISTCTGIHNLPPVEVLSPWAQTALACQFLV